MTDPAGKPPAPGTQPRGPGLSALVGRGWRSATQRVISLTALGMAFGLLGDVLTAARLGTGYEADALIVALTLPLLIDTIMREGTKFSLIALFLERRAALSEPDFHRFVSGGLNISLVAGGSFAIVLLVFAPLITSIIGPGLPPDGHDKAVTLLRLAAPLVLFAPAGTLLGVYLNSQRVFTPVALRNAVAPGLVVVAFGLAWKRADVVNWVAAAYVVGFATFFLTLFRAAVRSGHRQQWRVWPGRSELSLLWHAGSLPTLGFGVRQSVRIVERALASLGPPGGVAAYYFAFRVFSASQTVIGTSLATTSLPRMAEADLTGNRQRLGGLIRRSLKRSLMLSLPIALLFMLFHTEIVSLVYARGAFHGDSVTTSAKFFLLFGIALPFSCAVPVLQSGLYAQRAYGSVLKNMTFTGVLNIAMAVLLNHWFGLPGVAVAVSLSATSAVLNLLRLLRKSGVRVLGSADQPAS